MSTLRTLLQDYLTMRRALGYKLRSDGASLSSFVSFMERQQADFISTSQALAWATPAKNDAKGPMVSPFVLYSRLCILLPSFRSPN